MAWYGPAKCYPDEDEDPDGHLRPSKRNFHCSVVVGDAIYVIGGTDGVKFFDEPNTGGVVWMLDLSELGPGGNNEMWWDEMKQDGVLKKDKFTGRSRHTAVVFGETILVFGGVRGGNDVWAFDTTTRRWTRRANATGRIPKARFGHCAAMLGANMYIFAGHDGKKSLNDLYKFDAVNNTWSELGNLDNLPPPSPNYQMQVVNSELIVFSHFFRVVYRLEPTRSRSWEEIQIGADHRIPKERSQSVIVTNTPKSRASSPDQQYSYHSFFLIGGVGAPGEQYDRDAGYELVVDEANALKYSTPFVWNWSKFNSQGSPPRAFIGHSAVYYENVKRDIRRIIVFGGTNRKLFFDDIYILNFNVGLKWETVGRIKKAIAGDQAEDHLISDPLIWRFGHQMITMRPPRDAGGESKRGGTPQPQMLSYGGETLVPGDHPTLDEQQALVFAPHETDSGTDFRVLKPRGGAIKEGVATPLTPDKEIPAKKPSLCGFSLTAMREGRSRPPMALLFGGGTGEKSPEGDASSRRFIYSDLWELTWDMQPTGTTLSWAKTTRGPVMAWPEARVGHGATAVGSDKLCIVGGFGHDRESGADYLMDVWLWSVERKKWSQKWFEGSDSRTKENPQKRLGHSINELPGLTEHVVLFGGSRKGWPVDNRLYVFDFMAAKWFKVPTSDAHGRAPHARFGHCAVSMAHDRILICGGVAQPSLSAYVRSTPNKSGRVMDDCHILTFNASRDHTSTSIGSFTWANVSVEGMAPIFGGRFRHGACIFEDELYIFGGSKSDRAEKLVALRETSANLEDDSSSSSSSSSSGSGSGSEGESDQEDEHKGPTREEKESSSSESSRSRRSRRSSRSSRSSRGSRGSRSGPRGPSARSDGGSSISTASSLTETETDTGATSDASRRRRGEPSSATSVTTGMSETDGLSDTDVTVTTTEGGTTTDGELMTEVTPTQRTPTVAAGDVAGTASAGDSASGAIVAVEDVEAVIVGESAAESKGGATTDADTVDTTDGGTTATDADTATSTDAGSESDDDATTTGGYTTEGLSTTDGYGTTTAAEDTSTASSDDDATGFTDAADLEHVVLETDDVAAHPALAVSASGASGAATTSTDLTTVEDAQDILI